MAANDCTSFNRIYYVLTTETAQNTISIVDFVQPKRNAHNYQTEWVCCRDEK